MGESKLLTAKDVAAILGYRSVLTVWQLARERKIDTVVIGHSRRFTQEGIDKFIKEHTLPAKHPKDE